MAFPKFDKMLPSEARRALTEIFYTEMTKSGCYESSRRLVFSFAKALSLVNNESPFTRSIAFDCYSEAEIEYRRKEKKI